MIISFAQKFVFQSWNFFLTEAEYCCLAIFSVIRLSSFYLVTAFINVRLEWNFICPCFQASPHSWPARQWLPPSDVVWFTWLFLFYLGYIFIQENEKQNLRVNFTSVQNLEETRNKKCLFLTMTERTTGGQSNFVGTRTEETIIVTKKIASKWWRVFLLLELLHCQIYRKTWLGVLPKIAILYHEICVGTKGKRQFVYGRWHCSELYTNWSKFYWRKFSFDQF